MATSLVDLLELLRPIRFEFLHAQVDKLSETIGFDADQLRYCLALFAAYPFAVIFRIVPRQVKPWFSFLVGVFVAQFVLGREWIHSFITSTITYFLVKWTPVSYAPFLVFAFNMLYLSASHLYRIYVDYLGWSLDFTGPQMLLVIKLTSFAYNVYDGSDPKLSTDAPPANAQLAKVYATRRSLSISKLPSFIEFYGYTYCFATFLAGPAFEYQPYVDVIKSNGPKGSTRSCLASALGKLLIGLGCLGVMIALGPQFSLHECLHATTYATVFHQWGSVYVALLVTRCKYYFAWKVAEGSTVLCGFGHTNEGWDGVSNVDILGFELGQNIRDLSRAWNQGTQAWLQRYVYERWSNSLLATYFVSAFWHGFYPGYYLFFLSVPLATAVNRLARSVLRPHFQDKSVKFLYDIVGIVATSLTINYLAVSFVALSWEESLYGWTRLHFAGHIGLVVAYLVLQVVPRKKVAKAA
ncbi:Lysophospholipid acyltransferase 1 [Aphanomyces cochlioides]|nr:Lysophospholipid acyltransferase 1 [Aphanomyces cochlioides]